MDRLSRTWVLGAVVGLIFAREALASGGPPGGVPEIDPGTLGPALTVLIGGLLMLGGKAIRRK